MTITTFFPFSYIREKQRDVLREIDDGLKSGIKYFFLEAPTGFGKSAVAATVARYLESSHICTATKDLQGQYTRDFPFIKEIKGKNNFSCILKEEQGHSETCEYGPCMKEDEFDCVYKTRLLDYKIQGEKTKFEKIEIDSSKLKIYQEKIKSTLLDAEWKPCHYYHQKWIGIKSSHTIYNYKYFFSDIFFANTIQKRTLCIFDEAHTIESEISDFKTFTLYGKSISKLFPRLDIPSSKEFDIETWSDFCYNLKDNYSKFIVKTIDLLENKGRLEEPYTEKNLIDAINREKILTDLIRDMRNKKNNWLVTNVEKGLGGQISKVSITPIDTSIYFRDALEVGSYHLFMSATILDKEQLSDIIGIEKNDQVKFIKISDSEFPVENRPIRLMNVAWLNAKNMESNLPLLARAVDNIMTIHKNEKGIIHTTSYSQLNYIKENLSKTNRDRLIETNPNIDRNLILSKHYESRVPTVLISPSFYLGLDLKDDLSRFQIILKVPYPDLRDRKISEIKKINPKWYTWNTIVRLIQAYGRSIRSKDDHATTYILDSSVNYLFRESKDMIPKWFSDAILQKD